MSKVIQKRVKDLSLDDFIFNIPSGEGGEGGGDGGSSGPHTHTIADITGLSARLDQLQTTDRSLSSDLGRFSTNVNTLSANVNSLSAKVATLSPSCDASNVYFSRNMVLNVPFGRFGNGGGEYVLSCAGMTFEQLLSSAFTEPVPEPEPRLFYWGTLDRDNAPDLSEGIDNIGSVNLKDSANFNSGDAFPQNGALFQIPTGTKTIIFAAPAGEWPKKINVTDNNLHGPVTFENSNGRFANALSVTDSSTGEQVPYDVWYCWPDTYYKSDSTVEINWVNE